MVFLDDVLTFPVLFVFFTVLAFGVVVIRKYFRG